MANLRQTPLTCSGHTRPVVDLAFSDITPFGYFLISACKDGKPMIRQGDTGDWIGTFEGHKGAVWGATLNSDATRAATGAADFSAKLWHAEKGNELHTFPHKHIVKSVAFNKDGTLLLTGSNEKLLRIFDLGKPEAEPKAFSGHTSNIKGALFSADGKQVFSASDDKTVRVWDADSCEEKQKLTFDSAPTSLTLSSSGKIMIITYGQNIAFYNVDTNGCRLEEIKKFTAEAPINSASLHQCEKFFVAGGEDFKMYKFDYETGKEIESFKGHFGPVHCVRFSPDGELYASGSEDGTLRLWQTTIGKTYGLWKCVIPDESDVQNSNVEVKNNTEVKVES